MSDTLAALPRIDKFKPRGAVRGSRRGRWRAVALIAIHVAAIAHVAHWKITGETITPLEPSEARETFEFGYVNAGFLLLVAGVLATIVFGRFFCGWACHFIAYQDLCAWICKKLGVRPRPMRSRLLVWIPLGAGIWLFFWPVIERWIAGAPAPATQWELTTAHFWETFPGLGIALLTIFVDGVLLVYWLGAKGFCTYGCPYGGFFAVADRFAFGRIRVTDACEQCGQCTAVCSSNVRVHAEVAQHGMVVDSGCMKCTDCVSNCPTDALYFGFGKPSLFAKKTKSSRPSADFTWGEELAMVALFLVGLIVTWGLYELVPRLLALGLGVMVAFAGVIAWRLLRRPELRVQHRQLKLDGGLTGRGRLAALTLLAGALLFAHSAFVRYHTWRGISIVESTSEVARDSELRGDLLVASLGHLETAESWGLLPDAGLQNVAGLIQMERGELEDAERRFRRVIELRPYVWAAKLRLADLRMAAGDEAEAEQLVREVLADRPEIEAARHRLEMLEQRRAGQQPTGR